MTGSNHTLTIIALAFCLYVFPAQTVTAQEVEADIDSLSENSARVDTAANVEDEGADPRRSRAWSVTSDQAAHIFTEDIVDFAAILPTIFPLDLGSVGQASSLVVRGGTPQQTAVSLHGLTLYEPIFGFPDASILPVALVEEVSFSGDAVQIHPAYGGIVQVRTMKLAEQRPYSRVHFRTGDWGYSDIGISFGLPVSRASHLTFTGNRQEFDGFLGERRNFVNSRFFGTFLFGPHPGLGIGAVVMFNRNKVDVPAPLLPDLAPNLDKPRRKSTRFDSQVSVRVGSLSKRGREFLLSAFFSRNRIESINDTTLFDNEAVTMGGTVQGDFSIGRHVVTLGGGLRVHDLESDNLEERADNFGYIFAAEKYEVTPVVTLGLRATLEKYEGYDLQFTPAARLDFALANGSQFWLDVSSSRRYPSFSERLWRSEFFRGNADLDFETRVAGEIGFQTGHKKSKLQSAAFVRNVNDWIGVVFTAADTSSPNVWNLDHRTVMGVELEFAQAFGAGGELGLSGSILRVSESEDEKQLQVPEYVLYPYVEFGRPLFENTVHIRLRVNGRIFGERAGLSYDAGTVFPRYVTRSSDAVFDAMFTLVFAGPTVKFSYENIFDLEYELVPGFSMPPRTLRFEIAWAFWD